MSHSLESFIQVGIWNCVKVLWFELCWLASTHYLSTFIHTRLRLKVGQFDSFISHNKTSELSYRIDVNGFDLNGQTENKVFRLDCKLFPITQDYAIKTSTQNKLNNYFQLMSLFFQSKFEGNLHL